MDLEQRLREEPLKVRDVWSAEHAARLPGRVLQLRRRRSLTRAALATSVLLCAGGLLLSRTPQHEQAAAPRHATAAQATVAIAAAPAQDVVILHDGSRAEPADSNSRLAVLSDRPEHVRIRVEQGGARFDVVHNPKRAFEVEAGPVLVRVAGTIFSVTRTDDGARVAVEQGRVHVFWANQSTDLVAGESRMFPPPTPFATAPDETLVAHKNEPTAGSALGWRDLAQRGEYKQAYSALHRTPARVQNAPEDLMLAADVARLSGHPEQAVPHLRAVSEHFAADPRAPVAAFTLGGVLLHDLEQPRAAAAAFHRARALWAQGPLALDAWASEAEALHAAGDDAAAAQLAMRYLTLHPEGRHAHAMQALAAAE